MRGSLLVTLCSLSDPSVFILTSLLVKVPLVDNHRLSSVCRYHFEKVCICRRRSGGGVSFCNRSQFVHKQVWVEVEIGEVVKDKG